MCQTQKSALAAVAAALAADLSGANARDAEFASKLVRPDPSSWSNHSTVRVEDYKMDLSVDFATSKIFGTIVYTVKAMVDSPDVLALDFKGQEISSITISGIEADSWVSHIDGALGQALVIRLPSLSAGETAEVTISFTTSPSASALQWLPPAQTATKKHPYLFTQCQAIHCRTLIPCQDSPGVKSTYTASVVVPKDLTALMSAVIESPEGEVGSKAGTKVFRFTQKVPIPAYLIALAVGELEKRDVSSRCAVWSDPSSVDRCATELDQLDSMLVAAEELNGPYVWGRYDVLVLPPSFPYGGMENPCLTFATPSIIAGDKSLVNVILHEAQHSWSGNLVTNDTWESFFLNEGFTVFGERKLVAKLYGQEQKGLHTAIGWQDLRESVELLGHDNPFTCLQVDLSGQKDPDDAFSSVPYEKGFTLLAFLESCVGVEVMEKFLKTYFAHFSHQSINSFMFKDFFLNFARENGVSEESLSKIDWNTWFYTPGMPQKVPFDDSLAIQSKKLAEGLLASSTVKEALSLPETSTLSSWSTSQKIVLLDALNAAVETAYKTSTNTEELQATAARWRDVVLPVVGETFHGSGNAEIMFRYLTLQVRLSKAGLEEDLKAFLSSIGRMKFTRPLFRDLFASALYRKFGCALFAELAPSYHSICSKMVQKDLDSGIAREPTYFL